MVNKSGNETSEILIVIVLRIFCPCTYRLVLFSCASLVVFFYSPQHKL